LKKLNYATKMLLKYTVQITLSYDPYSLKRECKKTSYASPLEGE